MGKKIKMLFWDDEKTITYIYEKLLKMNGLKFAKIKE